MKHRYIFFLILGIDALILLLETSELSISYREASMLYGDFSFLFFIEKLSISFFGQNDFALRFAMVIFHILSLLLFYKISKRYVRHDRDRLWLVLIFVLLPGVISSAMLVDSAGLIIFFLLLFVYLYEKISKPYIYLLLSFYIFIDGGFAYLFFSLIFFSLYKKENYFLVFNIIAFFLSMYLFGIDTQGLPKGHFLDAIGLYSAIFTPIVFVYIFYILYRRYLTKEIELLWFISSITLIVSLLLSFRQRIDIEDFAPYLIMALPLAAQTFSSSYRVRLKIFRGKYKIAFVLSILLLLLNSVLVLFNKNLYTFFDKPQKHFAYKMHIAKELAQELKKRGIYCVQTDKKMQKRLKFYKISRCETYLLSAKSTDDNSGDNVTISYNNIAVYNATVTEINNR
jgi:hypothetical protein